LDRPDLQPLLDAKRKHVPVVRRAQDKASLAVAAEEGEVDDAAAGRMALRRVPQAAAAVVVPRRHRKHPEREQRAERPDDSEHRHQLARAEGARVARR